MTETGFYENGAQIKDPNTARELAVIEATMGVDKRLSREQELKRLHETGLTDEERQMIVFNEGLVAKYPHVFSTNIGTDGKIYYGSKMVKEKEWLEHFSMRKIILTDRGILSIMPTHQEAEYRSNFVNMTERFNSSDLASLVFNSVGQKEEERFRNNHISVRIKTGPNHAPFQEYETRLIDPFAGDNDGIPGTLKKVESEQAEIEQRMLNKLVPSIEDVLSKF